MGNILNKAMYGAIGISGPKADKAKYGHTIILIIVV